jgi:hypothetical protein
MLSPTIIGGDSSSCNDAQITAREKTARIAGTINTRTFISTVLPFGSTFPYFKTSLFEYQRRMLGARTIAARAPI